MFSPEYDNAKTTLKIQPCFSPKYDDVKTTLKIQPCFPPKYDDVKTTLKIQPCFFHARFKLDDNGSLWMQKHDRTPNQHTQKWKRWSVALGSSSNVTRMSKHVRVQLSTSRAMSQQCNKSATDKFQSTLRF